ncbi:MAG: hypothetical protein EB164_09760 [Thaumarchaeota archaeon]|nr:hypothetical protein [Nitrososphaerota archaeon]
MTVKDAFDNSIKVPFFAPEVTDQDRKIVFNALKSPLLTDGPVLRKFEARFASYTKSKYAVGVSNATSALHLSLRALNIGKDDEVIIPDMTFVATASSVILKDKGNHSCAFCRKIMQHECNNKNCRET